MRKKQNKCPLKRKVGLLLCMSIFFIFIPMGALDPDVAIDGYIVEKWGAKEGLVCNYIQAMAKTPDGYLWLATDRGLVRFDGVKFKVIPFILNGKEGKDNGRTVLPGTVFTDREGVLWIGSSAGLTCYNYKDGEFETYDQRSGFLGDRIRRIREDMNGNLWIGNWVKYISRFNRTNRQPQRFTHYNQIHGLKGKKVNAILEDKMGRLLVGTRERGVFIFRNGRFHEYRIDGMTSEHVIMAMLEDEKGRLWIGTGRGVFRVEKDGKDIAVFTVRNGLSHNWVIDIMEDRDRNIWFATMSGLNRLKEKDPFKKDSISFEKVLEGHMITGLMEDTEKSLWLGTDDSGLMRLREEKKRLNKIPPPVVIETVLLGKKDIIRQLRRGVEIYEQSNRWTFRFTAPSFTSPEKIAFKYKLENRDEDWIYVAPNETRIARYSTLNTGSYTFRIIACNCDGVWSKVGASLSFRVKKCFQHTNKYKILLTVLFLLAVSFVIFYLIKRKRTSSSKERYKGPPLDPLLVETIIKKLIYQMDVNKIYRDEELSLQSLAEILSIHPRQLSRILNDNMNHNFADFINKRRIEDAKTQLSDTANSSKKIIDIAYSAGFSSKATFNNAFKKYTCVSPSQYRKTHSNK